MEKKKLNFIMQISFIVVFAFVALGSGLPNKAIDKRVTAANAAIKLLRSNGYEAYDLNRDYSSGLEYLRYKQGNCKAAICKYFSGDNRNSQVWVIFQNCEASSSLQNEINNIANCTYVYDSSNSDYSSSSGGTSPSPSPSSSSSSSKDCSLNHWIERRGDSYVPYFQKSGDCALSMDYSIYSVASGKLLYSGHLYFIAASKSPATGYSYNENIRIVITSKKWD